ncbi:MAG: hypothetical protein AAF480_20150 [Actinomycetota bacterium]
MRTLLALAVVVASLVAVGPVAAAQETEEEPVTITQADQPAGGIIVQPNSGVAPDDPGDRGGALQLTLLALILGFVGVAFYSIRRSSRKALAAQGRA